MPLTLNTLGATSQAAPTAQSPQPAQADAVATSSASGSSASSSSIDNLFAQPSPPRFPWLSNLGRILENEAQNRFKFSSAPALGDKIDVRA